MLSFDICEAYIDHIDIAPPNRTFSCISWSDEGKEAHYLENSLPFDLAGTGQTDLFVSLPVSQTMM